MKYIRIASRAVAGLIAIPVITGLLALQRVVGPLTGNYKTIPSIIYGIMRKLIGYKVEFNAASAPLVKGKQTWFLVNHLSGADAFIVGGALDGSFVARDDVMRWPVLAEAARSIKMIGVRRKSKFNDQSRGKIAKNFNEGYNTIMFPEGSTSDGKKIFLFHAAFLTLLYGDTAVDKKKKRVTLQKDVVVQPVAIRVKSVDGKDAIGNDELRNLYSLPGHNTLKRKWKRAQGRNITLELTLLPPLDPKDFKDAKELANKAALDIASIVNPGQTIFEKAVIPGYTPAKPARKK